MTRAQASWEERVSSALRLFPPGDRLFSASSLDRVCLAALPCAVTCCPLFGCPSLHLRVSSQSRLPLPSFCVSVSATIYYSVPLGVYVGVIQRREEGHWVRHSLTSYHSYRAWDLDIWFSQLWPE